ncbi:HlyD family secretion protein [Leeia sp.]|uniref:HlyD family secretion protein n=1 Tax=Leeia sp. TaxID=2884678 RepID=UPI0035B0CB37
MDTPAAPKKQNKARLVLLLATLGIGAGLGYKWWHGNHYVSTDNAQIEGHIVPVLPKIGGYIDQISVRDNQLIKAGDVIAVLDIRDLQARLNQAEAELAAAQAAVGQKGQTGQIQAQISVAEANASAARANIQQAAANADKARKDYQRIQSLVAQKFLPPQQLDAAAANLQAAEANLQAMRSNAHAAGEQVQVGGANLKQAEARVQSARAARDYAALQLSYSQIKAPVAGRVSKKSLEPGQLVQPGQLLLSLVPENDLWVTANFKETDIGRIHAGQKVEVEVDAYPGHAFEGEVDSVSAATGARFSLLPPDNATGNFTKVVQRVPVKIRLNKLDPAHYPLRPGMSVVATVVM